MNILLLGYGKMGQIIEGLALEKGHHIVEKIQSSNLNKLNDIDSTTIDVAIEFSNPNSVIDNIKWCLDRQLPVVVGTTGWSHLKSEIDEYCLSKNGTYLFASNFSIGVNIFFKLNEVLAEMLNKHATYKPSIKEVHHTQKLDAPSGTAITLAEGLIQQLDSVSKWTEGQTATPDEVPIESQRVDPTPGTHIIKYDSDIDAIEIKHTAHSRLGFASGALAVAEWIKDKKGVLSMKDFLEV